MKTKYAAAVLGAALLFAGGINITAASSLTQQQINSIVGLLQAFGVDQGTIANVEEELGGNPGSIQPPSSTTPSATIDQSSLTQQQGTFTLTGTANNIPGAMEVWLTSSSYTGATDFSTLFNQLGKDGIYSLVTSVQNGRNGRWSAPFTWNRGPATFHVFVFNADKSLLTTGTLTVIGNSAQVRHHPFR